MTIMRGNRVIDNIYYGAAGSIDPSVLNGKVDKFTDLQLKNEEDLNNYKARRRIKLSSSSLLNCPNGWGMMEVLPDEVDDSHAGRQIIYANNGDIYSRCWEGTNWITWRLMNSSEADTLDGKHASDFVTIATAESIDATKKFKMLQNLQQGFYVSRSRGGGGTDGFLNIATIQITDSYLNQPITFKYVQRGLNCVTSVVVVFSSEKELDPRLIAFKKDSLSEVYINKTDVGLWDIYVRKTEGYDDISVVDLIKSPYMNDAIVTSKDIFTETLPDTAISATRDTFGINIRGNADTVDGKHASDFAPSSVVATSDATIYVATTGSDTTGDGTQAKPYKTIQKGINSLPRITNCRSISLNIADGTYTEIIDVVDICGSIVITGNNVTINGRLLFRMVDRVSVKINNLTINNSTADSSLFATSATVQVEGKTTINANKNAHGINVNVGGTLLFVWGTAELIVNNANLFAYADVGGEIFLEKASGTNNNCGYYTTGGVIKYHTNASPSLLGATNPIVVFYGGTINNNIYGSGTTDLTAGTSYLPTGMMYYVYE